MLAVDGGRKGTLLAFSLKKFDDMTYDDFVAMIEECGLEEFATTVPSRLNLFKRLTKAMEKEYRGPESTTRYKMYLARIDDSANPVKRIIGLAEIDRENKVVYEGKNAVIFTFDRYTTQFSWVYGPDFPFPPQFLREEIKKMEDEFLKFDNCCSSGQIRKIFNDILQASGIPANGISALWTIPQENEDMAIKFKNLADMINAFRGEESIHYKMIPMIDTAVFSDEEESLSVKDSIVEDTLVYAKDALRKSLNKEIEAIERSGGTDRVKSQAAERFRKALSEISDMTDKYKDLLSVHERLEVTKAAKKAEEEFSTLIGVEAPIRSRHSMHAASATQAELFA